MEDNKEETIEPVTEVPVAPSAPEAPAPKKKGKVGLILIIVLIVLLLGVCVWFFVLGGNGSKKGQKESSSEEKDKKLSKEQVKEIYMKYHTENYSYIDCDILEKEIYNSETFKVSELKSIHRPIASKIYNDIQNEIKDKKQESADGLYYNVSDIEEFIKREFKNYFGDNLEYNIELFKGCHPLTIGFDGQKEKFFEPVCSACIAGKQFDYEMTSYEQKDDKLYIYEKVNFYMEAEENQNTSSSYYKWTYTKYKDTYVLLEVEKE